MPLYTYTYSISADFPNQLVSPDALTYEIYADVNITAALDNINTSGDNCYIVQQKKQN